MSIQTANNHRENAEIITGDSLLCKQKSKEILEKIHMPKGLLPLDDIEEMGYNETTGYVWLRQKKGKEHKFKMIGKQVWYDTEVTAFVENQRLGRLKGVKSKGLLIWITINEIYIDAKDPEKITFGTSAGISKSFPTKAFEEE
ncbi:uncharacterized protein LOC124942921 [Impatiens glandulifera]|uniref:uncharacterized protein LOC124942921 n=1 Tax=Impatiens glandulifera TaxID=253017 RepID=UPI001FB093B0|nr:uncharacterized protein LOC124942921 [Impatiens glandulifera]